MTERKARDNWGREKREARKRFKMRVALVVFVVSVPIVVWTTGIAQYFGVGLGSISLWHLFPDSHELVFGIVDRLPLLKSKPKTED